MLFIPACFFGLIESVVSQTPMYYFFSSEMSPKKSFFSRFFFRVNSTFLQNITERPTPFIFLVPCKCGLICFYSSASIFYRIFESFLNWIKSLFRFALKKLEARAHWREALFLMPLFILPKENTWILQKNDSFYDSTTISSKKGSFV